MDDENVILDLPVIIMNINELGFRYYPFDQWEASQDSHLEDYFLAPDMASVAWKDIPTIIFAPRGGGKSALRVYTERVCDQSMGLIFPVIYLPSETEVSTLNSNPQNLATPVANDILRYLISNPDRFLQLSITDQKEIIRGIRKNLSSPLDFLLQLPYSSIARLLRIRLDKVKQSSEVLKVIRDIDNSLAKTNAKPILVNVLLPIVQEVIRAKSVYILIDGVDGFYETGYESEQIQKWIAPLLDQAQVWQESSVYVKAFLPLLQSEPFYSLYQNQSWFTLATIVWDDTSLVDLLHRRVAAASNGKFESLDEKCELGLRDFEARIVDLLPEDRKLPREALVLTHNIIETALLRTKTTQQHLSITLEDVNLGWKYYVDRLPQVNSYRIEAV